MALAPRHVPGLATCSSRTQVGGTPGTVDPPLGATATSDHRHDRAGHAAQ